MNRLVSDILLGIILGLFLAAMASCVYWKLDTAQFACGPEEPRKPDRIVVWV